MAIKKTVTEHDFREAFRTMNRGGSFSYEGLGALYAYLSDLSDDIGEDIEMDVIALCGEFSEYELGEFIEDREIDIEPYVLGEDSMDDILDHIRDDYDIVSSFERMDRRSTNPHDSVTVDSIIVREG